MTGASLRTLYPASAPSRAGWLAVGDGHEIYFEESGPENGLPVVFLHGGPGGGCKPSHRQFFDPARYRAVIVDQRGAGQSRPFGETRQNTTWHLVADLERLRQHLGIKAWVLFAGSWGVALGLAYAQTHAERVLGMVFRGSFLARQTDWEWFLDAGAARMLPEPWACFTAALDHPDSIAHHVHDCLFGQDEARAVDAARAWMAWSSAVVMYSFNQPETEPEGPLDVLLAKARIELHYAVNRYFLRDNQLLEDAGKLPQVPVHIVHGQRDLTCTPQASWLLQQAIPGARLEILRTTGHLSGEPLMTDALLRAADEMADRLRPHG